MINIVGSQAWKAAGKGTPKGVKGKGSRSSPAPAFDFSGIEGFDAGMEAGMMMAMGGMMDMDPAQMNAFQAGMMYGMKGKSPMFPMAGGMPSKSSMVCGKGGKLSKGGKGQDANHGFLVQRVKMVQKSHEGKEKWAEFITLNGGGKRDPALRSSEDLKEFLVKEDPEAYSYAGDVQLEAPTEQQKLAAQVRKGQKHSEDFKEAWWQYVEASGQQFRDPSRHDEAFLQAFLEAAPYYEVPGQRDPDHAELVARIKDGQRQSAEFKAAWQEYCNMNGQPRFDPARHDGEFIRGFLEGVLGDDCGVKAKRPRTE